MQKSITDSKWEELINKENILSKLTNELVTINAPLINRYRECRLMTKFDHTSSLPNIFKKNKLNILPISRKQFLIGKFDVYSSLNTCYERPIYKEIPDNYVTLPTSPLEITSEQTAIACAYASGIIHDFTQDDYPEHMISTISGRMGSGKFSFFVDGTGVNNKHKVCVNGAQMELDAVFESPSAIYIIEAKNHECKDFILRQLYYPYKYLKGRNGQKKPIIPIFMKYINGDYYLYKFRFADDNCINSAECESFKAYTIYPSNITSNDIDQLLTITSSNVEKSLIFPQADSFFRIEDMITALREKGEPLSVEDIRDKNLDFTYRQADYYMHAAEYLGLVEIIKDKNKKVKFTLKGRKIANLPYKEQKLAYAKSILESPIFSHAYRRYLANGCKISSPEIIDIINIYRSDLNNTTAKRRATTVSRWLEWITKLIN